jgi:hypothetical protein
VVDPVTGFGGIYTNGVLEKAETNSWQVFGSVSTAWSFIGRSLFSNNAWLNATIDEFRIYDGRLAAQEIAANYVAGPDAPYQNVRLAITNSPAGYTLNWLGNAPGFKLESTAWLGAGTVWNPVSGTPTISNGWFSLTTPATGSNAFFRLRR